MKKTIILIIIEFFRILKKFSLVFFLVILFLWFSIKTWYINNILVAAKYLSFDYNQNITELIINRVEENYNFSDDLVNRLKKDKTFSAYYILSSEATLWTYNKWLNSLFITDDKDIYNKDKIKEKINLWKYDDTIKHELIHYFLTYDDIREKAYEYQSKVLQEDKTFLLQSYNNEIKFWNPFYFISWFSPLSKLWILVDTFEYNPSKLTYLEVINWFEKYQVDKNIDLLREESITHSFSNLFDSFIDEKKKLYEENKLYWDFYKVFFKNFL